MYQYILGNHKRYAERIKLFLDKGYDVEKEKEFILSKAEPVEEEILELGTGKGYFAVALAKKGHKFISVDISPEEQNFARLNVAYYGLESQVKFVIGDAEKLYFEDSRFLTAFSINLIHHLEKPFVVMDELRRVVSPEGKIVISDFNDKGFDFVEEIHKSEGNDHSRGTCSMEDVEKYLLEHHYLVERYDTEFQHVIVAYEKGY